MTQELKTGYEWALADRVRPRELNKWKSTSTFPMAAFYEEKITYLEYLEKIKECDPKPNSTPRKTDMFLNYRMYGLVPYNLSPIQQGIQFGHAVVEYGQMVKGIPPFEKVYDKWAQKDKTFIILNGGTTNENAERLGSLQQYTQILRDNGVAVAEFKEPDLNDTLTAVVFLVDERVYDRVLYPDFVADEFVSVEDMQHQYNEWVKKIGGSSNVFLRTFLPTFRLA